MGFSEAVRRCFAKYTAFQGRARRSEYWFFVLFGVLAGIVASVLDSILFPGVEEGVISLITSLALLLPTLAVGARRLHDTGRSGWWLLLGLVPVLGTIILIIWFCQRSEGDNAHGPSPLVAA